MADQEHNNSLPSTTDRVQIDTARPFDSVKDAVSLFGEKIDATKLKLMENRISKEAELHRLQEEIGELRVKLESSEKLKGNALSELVRAKMLLEAMKGESEKKAGDGSAASLKNGELEMELLNDQCGWVSTELGTARNELEKVKEELLIVMKEKKNAEKQAEEAMAALEAINKRAEELSMDLSGANESLVLVKLACIEANKERSTLLATKDVQTLAERSTVLATRDVPLVAPSTETDEVTLLLEVEAARVNLKKATEEGSSLRLVLELLRSELEEVKEELAVLREREANASAAAVALTEELVRVKSELVGAAAAEAKASDSISALKQMLEQISVEAEAAKVEAERMREEAKRAKLDVEKEKIVMVGAESEARVALEEAELAKRAEVVAVERLKAVSEKAHAARASGVEGSAGIAISSEEYEGMQRKAKEAEEVARMKADAAGAQVRAVLAGEVEIRQKLALIQDDIGNVRTATQMALKRAEMAEAAKTALGTELRRLREKEQPRKEREEKAVVTESYIKTTLGTTTTTTNPPRSASLAKLLDIGMLQSEAVEKSNGVEKKKSKSLLAFLALLGRRKS